MAGQTRPPRREDPSEGPGRPVLSEARARKILFALRLVTALGVLVAVLGVFIVVSLVRAEGDHASPVVAAVILLLPAAVLLVLCAMALRVLPERNRQAKVTTAMIGAVLMLASLPLSVVWVGLVTPILGIVVLLLALLPDRDVP